MPTSSNIINESTTGICGFTGTAFTATPVTQYNILTGAATSSTINNVAPSSTSGIPLISQGASSQPIFGTAVVSGGGTGNTSTTAYALIAGGTTTTGAFQSITNGAAASTVLIGNGTNALPSFSATPKLTALGIGAAAGASGITFDGTNLLNVYSVGTFTPTITGAGSNPTPSYTTQNGYYVRVGAVVTFSAYISLSSLTGGTGAMLLSNLPFTCFNSTNSLWSGGGYYRKTTYSRLITDVQSNSTTSASFSSDAQTQYDALPSTTINILHHSGTYRI